MTHQGDAKLRGCDLVKPPGQRLGPGRRSASSGDGDSAEDGAACAVRDHGHDARRSLGLLKLRGPRQDDCCFQAVLVRAST